MVDFMLQLKQVVASGDEARIKDMISFLCAGQVPLNVKAMLGMDKEAILQSLLAIDKLQPNMPLLVAKRPPEGDRWEEAMVALVGARGYVQAVDRISQEVLLRFHHGHLAMEEQWWFALSELKRAPPILEEHAVNPFDENSRQEAILVEMRLSALYAREVLSSLYISQSTPLFVPGLKNELSWASLVREARIPVEDASKLVQLLPSNAKNASDAMVQKLVNSEGLLSLVREGTAEGIMMLKDACIAPCDYGECDATPIRWCFPGCESIMVAFDRGTTSFPRGVTLGIYRDKGCMDQLWTNEGEAEGGRGYNGCLIQAEEVWLKADGPQQALEQVAYKLKITGVHPGMGNAIWAAHAMLKSPHRTTEAVKELHEQLSEVLKVQNVPEFLKETIFDTLADAGMAMQMLQDQSPTEALKFASPFPLDSDLESRLLEEASRLYEAEMVVTQIPGEPPKYGEASSYFQSLLGLLVTVGGIKASWKPLKNDKDALMKRLRCLLPAKEGQKTPRTKGEVEEEGEVGEVGEETNEVEEREEELTPMDKDGVRIEKAASRPLVGWLQGARNTFT